MSIVHVVDFGMPHAYVARLRYQNMPAMKSYFNHITGIKEAKIDFIYVGGMK